MSRGLIIAIAVAGVAALIFFLVLASRSDALPWGDNYAAALATAKARNQIVVAYLHTDWCTYCKKMDAETFPSEQVKSQAGNYVWLRLNPERDRDGARLRQQYAVSGYPTFLFLDSNGARIDQIEGFMPPETFLQALAGVSSRVNALEALRAEARREPTSVQAQYALAEKYLEVKNYREAANSFAQVLNMDPDNEHVKDELAHYNLAVSLASLQEYTKAQEQLDLLVKRFPDSSLAPQVAILHGQILYQQGEVAGARASFKEFLQKYPNNENVRLVRRMLAEIGPGLPLSASH